MREEYGRVVALDGAVATVRVGRHAECSSCGACGGARQAVVEAENAAGAAIGDAVRFEFREQSVILGAFMVFVWPLIFAAFGGALGFLAAPSIDASVDSSATGGAVLFFLLSLVVVKKFDKKAGRDAAARPRIVEIVR